MGGEWVCEPTRADGHAAKAGRTHTWEEWVQRRLVCGPRGGARGKRLRSGEIGRGMGELHCARGAKKRKCVRRQEELSGQQGGRGTGTGAKRGRQARDDRR